MEETTLFTETRKIIKAELHQHVDGSIPIPTTWSLMKENDLNPVETIEEMSRLLCIQPEDESKGLLAYLNKFHYPLWVTQFYDNLVKVTYDIIEDAYVNHNVKLLELRYSPTIHTYAGLTPRQAIVAVLSGMNKAVEKFPDLKTGLIIIAMRHMGPHIAKILARLAVSESQELHNRCGVIGFDIAGAEKGNPPHLFVKAYEIARKGKLGLTAHAGEDEGEWAIWEAIDKLGCTRIGHGCSAINDKTLLKRLAQDKILIEVCQTSNYHTGAASRNAPHPLYTFLEYGIPVAICTDNTTVSSTNLTWESHLPILEKRLSIEQMADLHQIASKYTFIKDKNGA